MYDIDRMFEDKAFDCLTNDIKNSLKELYINIKGKPMEQNIPYIMQFVKTLPKGLVLTQEQKMAILSVVTKEMSDNEKRQLMFVLKLFNF